MRVRTALTMMTALSGLALASAAFADQPAALDAMASMHKPGVYHNFVLETDLSKRNGVGTGSWDLDGWIGGDVDKLWLKSEGDIAGGKAERAEIWALYSRNVSAFWDAQAGIRYDIEPDLPPGLPGAKSHSYLTAGVSGLAPYRFETEAHLFLRDDGAVSARLRQENEWLLTQKLILKPRIEINLNTRKDSIEGLGTGITDASLGLQARYEFRREFAPYLDVAYRQTFGETANYARTRFESPDETRVSVGIRWMF